MPSGHALCIPTADCLASRRRRRSLGLPSVEARNIIIQLQRYACSRSFNERLFCTDICSRLCVYRRHTIIILHISGGVFEGHLSLIDAPESLQNAAGCRLSVSGLLRLVSDMAPCPQLKIILKIFITSCEAERDQPWKSVWPPTQDVKPASEKSHAGKMRDTSLNDAEPKA